MIAENTPTTSDVTPMIAKFFMASMLEIGLALVITCLILNIHHSSHHSVPVPHFIRVLTIDVLAPRLFIATSQSKHSKQKKSNEFTRVAKNECFLLTQNLQEVNDAGRMNGHVRHDVTTSPNDVMESPSDVTCLSRDRRQEAEDETAHSDCDCRHVIVQCSGRGGLSSKGEEKLVRCVSYLAAREREKERQEETLEEWEIVAKVADRSFLILFFLTICSTTLLIFTQTPHHDETTNWSPGGYKYPGLFNRSDQLSTQHSCLITATFTRIEYSFIKIYPEEVQTVDMTHGECVISLLVLGEKVETHFPGRSKEKIRWCVVYT